eukprot:TRINITY_DN29750_c0_g1_i1.p1 TRINITY_DN29750_c0_g1~~TRINITY_DN29750_c0_g1_i1.p1  ORF type:complete len:987 (+),score=116.44 TRINITY_DN29750_c0_g1_i1:49-3009(+)
MGFHPYRTAILAAMYAFCSVLLLSSCLPRVAATPPEPVSGASCSDVSPAARGHRSLIQRSAQATHAAEVPKVSHGLEGNPTGDGMLSEVTPESDGFSSDTLKKLGVSQELQGSQLNDTGLCRRDVFAQPGLCPAACPYAARMTNEFCHFKCLEKHQCGLFGTDANATIPDADLKICRGCGVAACAECVDAIPGQTGQELDHCKRCMPGYSVTSSGQCWLNSLKIFISLAAISAVFGIGALIWYVAIMSQGFVNPVGVEYGLKRRHLMKLFPANSDEPYPLSTNLLTTSVAGPGTMAFFRFQGAILLWAVVLLSVWFGFAFFVSTDILVLGTQNNQSPQLLCAIVKWGRQRQLDLLWTKVAWLVFAYVFSFVGSIAYGVQQCNMFARVNAKEPTMTSFVAVLDGLPRLQGKDPVEDNIQQAVKASTGVQPEGISVAWNFSAHVSMIMDVVEDELEGSDQVQEDENTDTRKEAAQTGRLYEAAKATAAAAAQSEHMITDQVFSAWDIDVDRKSHVCSDPEQLKSLLSSLESTSTAYVAFSTQAECRQAVRAAASKGVMVGNNKCTLLPSQIAPEAILWENFHVTEDDRFWKFVYSIIAVIVCCSIWTVVLYIPYAWYLTSFSYSNGDAPGAFSNCIFISIVVGSQTGLFIVSSTVAKFLKFRSKDDMQRKYTVFYNAALILNVVMDIALQTYISYQQMVGIGAHDSNGRLLGSLTSLQEILESYPVQMTVGKLLYVYCWPCTFLLCFVAEPFVFCWLPQHIGQSLVGINKKIQSRNAMKALRLGEMDQGRYADLIFNVILVVCIPFVSPAYMAKTFGVLIISNIFLYVYDQIKVLRFVQKFNFSSPEVHWLGLQLFTIPCSMLACALVFKANQLTGDRRLGSGSLQGGHLWISMLGVGALHVIVHLSVLEFCVKPLGRMPSELESGLFEGKDVKNSAKAGGVFVYSDACKTNPATHFSTNPIHCLRSKYVLNHESPQMMYAPTGRHIP